MAAALHAGGDGPGDLRVAVRDGYEVFSESTPYDPDPDQVLHALAGTDLGALPAVARDAVRAQVTDVLARTAEG